MGAGGSRNKFDRVISRERVPVQNSKLCISYNEQAHDKIYNKTCVTSKDSDQPIHPPSIVRVLVHPSLNSPEAVEGTCDQRRLRSESSLVAQVLYIGFVVCWLSHKIIYVFPVDTVSVLF